MKYFTGPAHIQGQMCTSQPLIERSQTIVFPVHIFKTEVCLRFQCVYFPRFTVLNILSDKIQKKHLVFIKFAETFSIMMKTVKTQGSIGNSDVENANRPLFCKYVLKISIKIQV